MLSKRGRGAGRKLSVEDAAHLRKMYHDPRYRETIRTMAHLFRVCEGTVGKVLDRKGVYANDPLPRHIRPLR